jgi:hypothetical protein
MSETAEAAPALTLFYDSAAYAFPEDARYVMAYADGGHALAVPPGEEPLGGKYDLHWITVLGGSENWHAQYLDYEPGNPAMVAGRARAWAEARIVRGLRAVIYCDRANLHLLRAELGPVVWGQVHFWIPTLDGKFWDRSALAADIARAWGLWIQASMIWGSQGKSPASGSGGPWDTSVLFGSWD